VIVRAGQYRRWGVAGVVAVFTGAVMLAWVLRLLNSSTYGGVSTIDEMISRQTDVPAPEITADVRVSQTFVASDNDLTEVQIFVGTYARVNTVPLVFTLSEGNGPALHTIRADPVAIYDNAYHPFIFDPIPDSRGKAYTVTISSPRAKPGNAFTVWLGNCDCYPDGRLSVNGRPRQDQELAMRVDYQHSGVVVWKELINRMSQYKPEIVKGAGLLLLGFASTVFALAALGAVVLSAGPAKGEQGRSLWIAVSVVVAVAIVLMTHAYSGI
jgi:hypothetical protein